MLIASYIEGAKCEIMFVVFLCVTIVGTSRADSNSHYSNPAAVDVALVSVYSGVSFGWISCLQVGMQW